MSKTTISVSRETLERVQRLKYRLRRTSAEDVIVYALDLLEKAKGWK